MYNYFLQSGNQFVDLYADQVEEARTALNIKPDDYGQTGYDGTWALALALNKTITGE